jgi:hypothetical protein
LCSYVWFVCAVHFGKANEGCVASQDTVLLSSIIPSTYQNLYNQLYISLVPYSSACYPLVRRPFTVRALLSRPRRIQTELFSVFASWLLTPTTTTEPGAKDSIRKLPRCELVRRKLLHLRRVRKNILFCALR